MGAGRAAAALALLALAVLAPLGANAALESGTYTIRLVPSLTNCTSTRGYLSTPVCIPGQPGQVLVQPTIDTGFARRRQYWRLQPASNAVGIDVEGVGVRIRNDGRAAADPPCTANLMWLEACTPGIAARVVGQANPFWVLEPSAAPGRFYIRDSRCAPTSGKPAYLGYHKTVCTQLSPRLYNKTTPWADMLWTLSLVSAGTSGINDGDVRAGNVVMLWIRKATGPGVVDYRVRGVPDSPDAAILDQIGPGEAAAANQLKFNFTKLAAPGATYNFTVQARNSLGWGPLSSPFTLKVPNRPAAPTGLTVTVSADENNMPIIVAEFMPPANNGGAAIDAFQVYAKSRVVPPIFKVGFGTLLPNGKRRFIFTEFKPLNTYNFSAYARNIAGWSNASASVAIEAPNDGTCTGPMEPCYNITNCCFTSPALYCEKEAPAAELGACMNCVGSGMYGCAAVNACCDAKERCQRSGPADTNGFCRNCIELTKFGCANVADCCEGNACQRNAAADPDGACVNCVAPTKFGCFNSTTCCNGKLCQKRFGTDTTGSCRDCINATMYGCESPANCCGNIPCQKMIMNDTLGSCQTCIAGARHGCADTEDCCGALKCEKLNATMPTGTCRLCIGATKLGCAAKGDCCDANPCQKLTPNAAIGTCEQCIESTKHGCVGNTDCCDLNVCQKETLLNATGTCLSCIAPTKYGCTQKGECCDGKSCLKELTLGQPAGVCADCIPDAKFGCVNDTECCTKGFMCLAGQCRCATEKEECFDDSNCCGGGEALFCRKPNFLAEKGTCEKCVGDAQFGCSMAKNDSCCGYPLRVCEPSMSGFQCKKGPGNCTEAEGACVNEADCCSGTPALYCERSSIEDTTGVCKTCVADAQFGCSADSQCCTEGFVCLEGFCRCSLIGGPCVSDKSCCGAAEEALFCQRNSPSDKYGTCEACISNDKYGCSAAVDNCCSDFLCSSKSGAMACTCSAANGPCLSHGSCCPGASPYCQKDNSAATLGSCKDCLALSKYGCNNSKNCCGGNKCQRANATADGTCETCIALLSFGCAAGAECCGGNKCQRDASTDDIGSCQTCVALAKHGCTAAGDCCEGNTCQKEALDAPVGICQTCVAELKFGCASTAHCCGANKCEFEGSTATSGQCKQCVEDTKFGCATSADCCSGSKCQKAKPTDPLGFCGPCIPDDAFGCSTTEDDCCSDFTCQASQGGQACLCAAANTPCISSASCCNDLVCLRNTIPPEPLPFGNYGSCTTCIPNYKHGCISDESCCTAGAKCQKLNETSKGGTCETCISTDRFGCGNSTDCCGAALCQRSLSNETTGSCRTCIANNMFGCETMDDCCGGAICQRDRPGDTYGTCVTCVGDNKFGCDDTVQDSCCSDYTCQSSTSGANACICSPADGTCLSAGSCCNTKQYCQRVSGYDPTGNCKNCIQETRHGCINSADCCTKSNFCQKEERNATSTGSCATCIGDQSYGCVEDKDCCNSALTCSDGRCGCAGKGDACTSENSCCQDGPVPLYCAKTNYLAPLGTCEPCVADTDYGCSDSFPNSCCGYNKYACSLGLGGGLYVCRKTIETLCSLEGMACNTEADCCPSNPDAGEPILYCSRAKPGDEGTCEQCIPTDAYGCDTWDSAMSCCGGLSTPAAVCKDEGQSVGVCRMP